MKRQERIDRFRAFLEEIAAAGSGWEYGDGTPMQRDAAAFLAEHKKLHGREIEALKAELAAARERASWQLLAEGGLTNGEDVVWCDGSARWVGHYYDETGEFDGYQVMGRADEAPFYFRLPEIPDDLFQRRWQVEHGKDQTLVEPPKVGE